MENTKTIVMCPTSPPITTSNKTIQQKQKPYRKITTTDEWDFTEDDLNCHQINFLYDISKTPFLYKQIKQKIMNYKSQDIEKKIIFK